MQEKVNHAFSSYVWYKVLGLGLVSSAPSHLRQFSWTLQRMTWNLDRTSIPKYFCLVRGRRSDHGGEMMRLLVSLYVWRRVAALYWTCRLPLPLNERRVSTHYLNRSSHVDASLLLYVKLFFFFFSVLPLIVCRHSCQSTRTFINLKLLLSSVFSSKKAVPQER